MSQLRDYPVANLRPAGYNPRAITPDALIRLQESIGRLGFCKPIIVTTDDLIVAGHQRTKAARALGRATVPAWVIPAGQLIKDDEVIFNQLHNGTDAESCEAPVRIPAADASTLGDFTYVPPEGVLADFRMAGVPLRTSITNLLAKYGNWGGCIATLSGRVVSSPHYALAAAQIGMAPRVWRVRDSDADYVLETFGHQYGVFNYDHIERHTFNQTLAQLFRLREGAGVSGSCKASSLYRNVIEPTIRPGHRLIDFACGQADHVKRLQSMGHRAFGIELFFRNGARLDYRAVHGMIDAAFANWSRYGGFDIALADSVLNSVDSLQAESDVVTCLKAFAKPGGMVFASGRERSGTEAMAFKKTHSVRSGARRMVEFMDEHGFTAYQRGEHWFFQKFHTHQQVEELFRRHRFSDIVVETSETNCWRVRATRGADLPDADVEAALRREFSLPWPNGQNVGRADQAVAAWRAAREVEAKRVP